jgi:hypothetical protein
MADATIAIVSQDPAARLLLAKAFDHAPEGWAVAFCDSPPPDADVVVVDHPGVAVEAVVFDAAHPQWLIPEIQKRLQGAPTEASSTAVVVTGIRGSGVTSVALHLALLYGRRFDACFLDFDGLWSCADRLGLEEDVRTWDSVGDSPNELSLAALPVASGLRALVAPRGRGEADGGQLLDRVLTQFERIVVDLPYTETHSDVLRRADAAIVVMSPTVPHARRVERILAEVILDRIVVVTNRLGAGGETTRREIEAVLDRKVTLELPCCPRLRDAEGRARFATLEWSRWGRRLARLQRALETS